MGVFIMHKKLTITIDEKVYEGLYATIGEGKISQFIESLVKPHVLHQDLELAYREMALDEEREQEAIAWSEGVIGDLNDETMKRGEVWWIDFNPSVGGEIQKTRLAIIVSNDAFNKVMNRVQVVPVSSNTTKCYPCEAYVEIEGKANKAMADQLSTVSKSRLKSRIGRISQQNMFDVERAIKTQLDL
jgi:mRNA interferase MazF